jgi:chorismate dehydratase
MPGKIRVASVSYFNAKPLLEGLGDDPAISLSLAVPSALLELLRTKQADVALLPVIDYQRLENLSIVPAGGIGCDGPTLTVRIFSSEPIERISSLACDGDSHTSIALAQVILAERYGLRPEFVALDRTADAKLLIGDKVVCEEPKDLPHQIDLGAEWKALTGLPFVFAAWTAREGVDLGDLPARLEEARKKGLERADSLVETYAVPRGWPAGLARKYITEYLKYEIGPRELEGIRLFYELAGKHGVLSEPVARVRIAFSSRS